MSNSSDNTRKYDLPENGSKPVDMEQFRRGLKQEIEGLKEQLQGKRQQLSAIDRHLGREKEWD